MHPTARKEKLTVRELTAETLVFDHQADKAHCLNRTTALVWKHCDGQHDVAQLVAIVESTLGLPRMEADAAARLALDQLGRRNLLETAAPEATDEERLTRRRALRKLAVTAAALLPVVMSLRSPSIARAQGISTGPCTEFVSLPGPHGSINLANARNQNKPDGTPCTDIYGRPGKCKGGQCIEDCKRSGENCGNNAECCSGFCIEGHCSGN